MATVGLPLTGTGDATASVATDEIGGAHYQRMKVHDGLDGSTVPLRVRETTPDSSDGGIVVRPIASTGWAQAVVGSVGLTSGSSAVELTSAGSTRLVGRVTVENPTTAVTVSSGVVLGNGSSTSMLGQVYATGTTSVNVANPTTQVSVSSGVILGNGSSTNTVGSVALVAGSTGNTIGAVAQGAPAPTSDNAWWVRTVTTGSVSGGSTTVDANLTSVGSTKLVGQVTVANPTTAVSLSSNPGITSGSSEVALTSAGSTRLVGRVDVNNPTTAVTVSSGVILAAGSSANTIGSVALVAGATGTVGAVAQGAGSSANAWTVDGFAFSSANALRTTVNTSANAQIVAANSARRALAIQNLTTVDVGLGFSTAAVTTALANLSYILGSRQQITFGGQVGMLPNYTGGIMGITIGSTTISGGVAVTQFTNT